MWRYYTSTGNEKLLQGPQNLGSFTQAQWPPANPNFQDTATLADTYGNLTFAWGLEYRPDLDGTYPWRDYNGNTPCVAYVGYDNPGAGGMGTLDLPIAGAYSLYAHGLSTSTTGASNTITVGFGTSNGGTEIGSTTSAAGQPCSATYSGTFTATKGQAVYPYHGSSNQANQGSLVIVTVSLVKVANA